MGARAPVYRVDLILHLALAEPSISEKRSCDDGEFT